MQKIFFDTRILDKNAIESFCLSEDILIENAAVALENCVRQYAMQYNLHTVQIVTGSGNNGADGYCLARRLSESDCNLEVFVFTKKKPKSEMCKTQFKRAFNASVIFSDELKQCDLLVDCFIGSGFSSVLDEETSAFIDEMNICSKMIIACDVPSGINKSGFCTNAVCADETVTMGALKASLFGDVVKDFVGKISCCNLGISRNMYEDSYETDIFCIERSDLKLPLRRKNNVNKGSFGHATVFAGEKKGASVIAAEAAFAFGSGLVTVVTDDSFSIPYELMQSDSMPLKTTAIAVGMGFGKNEEKISKLFGILKNKNLPCVLDADVLSFSGLKEFLEVSSCVLTPHPKEFSSLLEVLGIGKYSVSEIQKNRFWFAKLFQDKFPDVTLVLKGANPIIASEGKFYVCSYGKACLAKGGSGDVLSGLIVSLLAQGYSLKDAAISGVLAHALASEKIETDFGMTPGMLINEIRFLKNDKCL